MNELKKNPPVGGKKLKNFFLFIFLLFLPTQFGKHFFLPFSYLNGVKIDYLSLVLYTTDILAVILILLSFKSVLTFVIHNKQIFITLLGLLFLNTIFSIFPFMGLYQSAKIFEVIFISYIMYKEKSGISVSPFLIGGIGVLILSLLQLYTHGSIQGIFYFLGERYLTLSQAGIAKASIQGIEFLRPYATFSHPNSLGGFYLLVYSFFLTHTFKKKEFLIKYVSFFVFSALIFLSFSKIVFVAYGVITTVYLFKYSSLHCLFCKIARIVGVIALGIIIITIDHDPLSLSKRMTVFNHALLIFKDHLLLGTGLGQYLYYEARFPLNYTYFFLQPVHNMFMLFLTQGGILLTGFIGYHIYRLFKHISVEKYLLPLAVVVLTGMFDHYWLTLQQNLLLLGVIGGFILRKELKS